MKFNKLVMFASLPLTAILAGCGGGGPAGPSATPSPSPSMMPTIMVTSDGVPVPGETHSVVGNTIRATAPGHIDSTVVSVKYGTATQVVDLWRIPEGWGQQDVVDLVYKSTGSEMLFPLSHPEERPVVFVPVAGTHSDEIEMLREAAAYWSAAIGYDFHVIAEGETTIGKAVFTFSVDAALSSSGATHVDYGGYGDYYGVSGAAIVGGSVKWRPGMGAIARHELGHTIGLGHLVNQPGLMRKTPDGELLRSGEVSTTVEMRQRRVGNTAPDTEAGLAASAASLRPRSIMFVCGGEGLQ